MWKERRGYQLYLIEAVNKLFLGLFDCHSGTEVQIRSHFLSEVTTIAHMLPVVSAQRPGE